MKVERERSDTVILLCNTLKSLLEKKAIEKISVSEIARHANIHRITFYYYFDDKYDLLRYVFEREVDLFTQKETFSTISDYIIKLYAYFSKNIAVYQNAFSSDDYQSLKVVYYQLTKEYFETVIDQLSDKSHFMVKRSNLVSFYSRASTEFLFDWLRDPNREHYEDVAKQLVLMIEHGLVKCIMSDSSEVNQ